MKGRAEIGSGSGAALSPAMAKYNRTDVCSITTALRITERQEHHAMTAWHEFYSVVAGVAATLLGLLFVSVSLNAETILGSGNKHAKRLAEQAFQNYLGVLLIALLVLVPGISDRDLGFSMLCLSLAWGAWVLVRAFQSARALAWDASRIVLMRRFFAPAVGCGLLIYAGYKMVTGNGDVRISIAAGVMVLLLSATAVAWDLLIKIAEQKYASRRD
jgi:hypothetical protein